MANETTTTTIAGLMPSEYFAEMFIRYAHDKQVAMPLTRIETLPERSGLTVQIQQATADTAAAITEGDDAGIQDMDIAGTDVTVGTAGLYYQVTKLAQRTNKLGPVGLLSLIAKFGAEFCVTLMESDLIATFINADTDVGTTKTDATFANWLSAIYTLETACVYGNLVAVVHPVQKSDIVTNLLTLTGTVLGSGQISQGLLAAREHDGFCGNLAGVDMYISNLVATANVGEDRAGAMWANANAQNGGNPEMAGFAMAVAWMPETTLDPQAVALGTDVVVDCAYAVAETKGTYYVGIVTDA